MTEEHALFRIEAVDEDYSVEVTPTEWLLELPEKEQIRRLRRYILELEGQRERVADGAEAARIARLIAAASRRLRELKV
jgi:hypothetical protein